MKKIFLLSFLVSLLAFTFNCNGQPKNNYEIYSDNVSTGVKYHLLWQRNQFNLILGNFIEARVCPY